MWGRCRVPAASRFARRTRPGSGSEGWSAWLTPGSSSASATPAPGTSRPGTTSGQLVVDELAARRGEAFKAHKANARVVEDLAAAGRREDRARQAELVHERLGRSRRGLARFYGVEPERIVVVHDELDIPFDTIKLKIGGGPRRPQRRARCREGARHPGFARVRVGIGRPVGRQDPADWVLDPFGATERKTLPILVADAADAVEQLIDEGLLAAQQQLHAPRA